MIANAEAMKGHRSIESFLWRKTATDKFADEFLPTTDCIFGRRSNPRSHRIYKVPSPGKIADFVADGETILEVRGSKHLTVFPGSVHPSGESIEFEEGFDGDPSLTDWAVLADAARKSATATLLFKNWIPRSRHSLALSASGFLRQLGWAEADAREVIRAVAKHAKDDEVFDHLECVNTTYAKTAGPILGRREVIDLLGEKAVAAIESWCESSQVRESISPTTPADSTNDSSDAFANAKRGQLIYRDDIDTWFKRDGQVFRAISYVQVQGEAKHFMQEQVGSAGFIGSTRSLLSKQKIDNLLTLSRHEFRVEPGLLDKDRHLIGCAANAKEATEQANAKASELENAAVKAKDAEAERTQIQSALDRANKEIERLKTELEQQKV